MFDGFPLKLFEGLAFLAAGVAFAWWQLRDVKRAQQRSAEARAELDRAQGEGATSDHPKRGDA